MDTSPSPAPAEPTEPPVELVLSGPELARMWSDLPGQTRKMLLSGAGRQWFDLWQSGIALDEIPPAMWGWRLQRHGAPLALPASFLTPRRSRVRQQRLVNALASWLHSAMPGLAAEERLRVISAFSNAGSLDRAARRQFLFRVFKAARFVTEERASSVYREVLAETNHLCRQAVDCRGIWLPEGSVSADEFRHDVEAALHGPDAVLLKQSDVATVVLTRLRGEHVVIKRHRLMNASAKLKYRWRMSRARRAWAAGVTMKRLGLPVAEPMGLLEIMRGSRVTGSYIINRWVPDCHTAYAFCRETVAGAPLETRRNLIAFWRDEWLRLLDRGVYHADTKLTNAMVRSAADGRVELFWIDLECVRAGQRLSRYEILRNVVQMVGLPSAKLSVRDRLFFLRDLPWPWLRWRTIFRVMDFWTARRLRREAHVR